MDAYGFSFALGAIKPQPQIYGAVCEALALPPSQVLMLGGTLEPDVLGPLAFGMRACHLVRGGEATTADALAALPQLL